MKQLFVYLLGLAALAVCAILLPELAREAIVEDPSLAILKHPFLVGAYVTVVPFFVALYQTSRLLYYIDNNTAFSDRSVKALQVIKMCTMVFISLVVLGVIAGIWAIPRVAPELDVTLIPVLGFIFVFSASVIATFVAVVQRLLEDAIEMQKENELTV